MSSRGQASWVVVGLDNGGTSNSATVLEGSGRFLLDSSSKARAAFKKVRRWPLPPWGSLWQPRVLDRTGVARESVRAVGLGTPGPASTDGVICSRGATNFSTPEWHGFDFRAALESKIGIPVVYNNDGNAAALYAHDAFFGDDALLRSSVSAIVGTGLGGGVIEAGHVIRGAAGMAGELGHVQIPLHGLLAAGQPVPRCNCGLEGDVESIASLTGIENNLLPYWLERFADHELHRAASLAAAARLVRGFGVAEDRLALEIFGQQAMALGRLFTIASNFVDPDAYFVGGGVVEASPRFNEWFLAEVRRHTSLRAEQARTVAFALIPHLDMAGARGAALAAAQWLDKQ